MSPDPELESLRADWQSLGGKEKFSSSLVERAARDGTKMKRHATYEVLGAAFSTTVCIWLSVRTHGSIEVVSVTTLILLFNGAWLMHFFALRASLFRATGETVDAFVTLTRGRLETDLKWIRFAQRWTALLGVLVLPWMVWVFVAHRDAYIAAPWRAVVGFGGAISIFAGVAFVAGRKAKKLRAESERFERELAEASLD